MSASIFPPSGGGSSFQYGELLFVSPNGSNNAVGSEGAPFKTGSAAYNKVQGPVCLRLAPNAKWSNGTEGHGLVDGQGCHLTGSPDFLPAGFLPYYPVSFMDWGNNLYGRFTTNVTQLGTWGKNDLNYSARKDPGFWFVNTELPVSLTRLGWRANQPYRVGWDYIRDADTTVRTLNVLTANRLNGSTTMTLQLKSTAIATMARSGNIVTVTFAQPTGYNVVRAGMFVKIDPGSLTGNPSATPGLFTAGPFIVLSATGASFTYAENGNGHVSAAPTAGTWSTHGIVQGDTQQYGVIEWQSTSAQFPSTMYWVESVSSDAVTVIVRDPYGWNGRNASTGTISTPGTYQVQLRQLSSSFDMIDKCSIICTQGTSEKLSVGPGIDRGDIAGGAEWQWIRDTYVEGPLATIAHTLAQVDQAKSASVFNLGVYTNSLSYEKGTILNGHIEMPLLGGLDGPGTISFRNILQDTDIGNFIFPTVNMRFGSGAGTIDNVLSADSNDLVAAQTGSVRGISVINTWFENDLDFDLGPTPVVLADGIGGTNKWAQSQKSNGLRRVAGWWGNDARISGKRNDAQWQFGVYQNIGLTNALPENMADGAKWTATGVTVTAGQDAPDGTTGAFKLHGAGTLTVDQTQTVAAIGPLALGDRLICGMWIRMAKGALFNGQVMHQLVYGPTGGFFSGWTLFPPFGDDGGWWYVTNMSGKVPAVSVGADHFKFTINGDGANDIFVYRPAIYHLPAATYSQNQMAYYVDAICSAPAYIPKGMAGTGVGVKMIGHGGFATNSANAKTVGVGSGQLTLTGTGTVYLPMYDLNGTTIIGWVAQLQASVNP